MNELKNQIVLFVGIILMSSCANLILAQKSSNDFVTTWKTDNLGSSNSTSVSIRTDLNSSYNFDIDWNNDGVFDTLGVTGNITNDYGVIGTYTIRIRGQFPRFNFVSFDGRKLISVDQWGSQAWTSMYRGFYFCENLISLPVDTPNLTSVTSMKEMFYQANSIVSGVDHWDVSNVTDMSQMFFSATGFNDDIGSWDVSSVRDMFNMFGSATNFNQPLNSWVVDSVQNMSSMFNRAANFNRPLNNWNVSSVTDMSNMFQNAGLFNRSLDNWDVSNVLNMSDMFNGAGNFNGNITSWNVSSVREMKKMFLDASSFNRDIGNWNVDSVRDMARMFEDAIIFNQDIGSWRVDSVQNISGMFHGASAFNQDIGSWNVGSVTTFFYTFRNATSFNQDIGSWDVSSAQYLESMFDGASSFNQDLRNWNIDSVLHTRLMFNNAYAFDQNLGNWNLTSIVPGSYSMWWMFNNSGMSVDNYDSTLIDWQAKPHPSTVDIGVLGLNYCKADSVRNLLIAGGWTFHGDSRNCTLVGLEETILSRNFKLYPNPTNGRVSIQSDKQVLNNILLVYDSKGQLVREIYLREIVNQLDFSDLESGLYFIHHENQYEKLIIQK